MMAMRSEMKRFLWRAFIFVGSPYGFAGFASIVRRE
jgi:hypothetical protein